jgi:adenylosuccinate lyase
VKDADWSRFASPFTWRYGSDAMRRIWSEENKHRLWRRIWVALAEVQCQAGLVSQEQVDELRAHQNDVDVDRAMAIDAEIHHDLMAAIKAYAEQCPLAGGVVHLGATSMDIEDNADVLRLREALGLIRGELLEVLRLLAQHIQAQADTPTLGYTHIQPAQPTTLGYRLCQYAQDALIDLTQVDHLLDTLRGKGFKGAVGTSAAYGQLLAGTGMSAREMETLVLERLGVPAVPVSTQTYPRKYDYLTLCVLAGIAQTLHKFGLDLRLLQSPFWGEMREPFGKRQVGSSVMPFKRNPVIAEGMCSLARFVATLPRVAWDNAALSILERTLDDSANRRTILPEAFLATEEILRRGRKILADLQVDRAAMERNLAAYAPFAATEPLLVELVSHGADRQRMHEVIREHSMTAWRAVEADEANPLADLLAKDERVTAFLSPERAREIMQSGPDVGDAPERCREFLSTLRATLPSPE